MSEAELLDRIQTLDRKYRALEERYQETDDLLQRLVKAGLGDMLKAGGGQLYGGGVMRIDPTGIQIKSGSLTTTPNIVFLPEFSSDPTGSFPNASIEGTVLQQTNSYSNMYLHSSASSDHRVNCEWTAQDNTECTAYIDALAGSIRAQIELFVDATSAYVATKNAPLWLTVLDGADPSTTIEDGMLWYRSDVDEYRVQVNGTVVKLVTAAV